MKLTELFPELEEIILGDKVYEVKFTTMALWQLELEYPDKIIDDKEISTQEQILNALNSGFSMMKTTDIIKLLFAGLRHTCAFKTKEALAEVMQPHAFPEYVNHILSAYQISKATPEQIEKMEIMALDNKSKKTMMEKEITELNMHSTKLNAD